MLFHGSFNGAPANDNNYSLRVELVTQALETQNLHSTVRRITIAFLYTNWPFAGLLERDFELCKGLRGMVYGEGLVYFKIEDLRFSGREMEFTIAELILKDN